MILLVDTQWVVVNWLQTGLQSNFVYNNNIKKLIAHVVNYNDDYLLIERNITIKNLMTHNVMNWRKIPSKVWR